MGHERAKDAMIILENEYKGEPRAVLLRELLKKVYNWESGI